jgi:uncharacterized delta-60 repeat protein
MANPGALDTSFGSGGKKTVNFGGTDAARVVLVQSNGRIVLAGGGGSATGSSFCVVRLRTNGTLDTTFGSGGKKKIDFGGENDTAFGGALQADGKIVLAGDSDFRVALVRLKTDGSLDASFEGDGKKLFSWGPIGRAQAVVVTPNGKLLVAGFSGPEGGNIQVARLNPNGLLDKTFGVAGKATVDFGGDDFGLALARQANGRILVAGRSTAAGAVVARLRSNGVLDPDFDGDGRVALAGSVTGNAIFVQPDRKIVVAGDTAGQEKTTVTRLMPNGSLDTTFGTGGTATIDFGSLADIPGGAALQPDGKIVVAGYSQDLEDVTVARLTANGAPDPAFGTAGKATVDFGAATFGFAVALQSNKRIVVAGQKTGNDDFAAARLVG